jgi:hypothetical protein
VQRWSPQTASRWSGARVGLRAAVSVEAAGYDHRLPPRQGPARVDDQFSR